MSANVLRRQAPCSHLQVQGRALARLGAWLWSREQCGCFSVHSTGHPGTPGRPAIAPSPDFMGQHSGCWAPKRNSHLSLSAEVSGTCKDGSRWLSQRQGPALAPEGTSRGGRRQGSQVLLGGLQCPIVPPFLLHGWHWNCTDLQSLPRACPLPSPPPAVLASRCYSAASLNRNSSCLCCLSETTLRAREKTEFGLRYQRVNVFLGLQMYL